MFDRLGVFAGTFDAAGGGRSRRRRRPRQLADRRTRSRAWWRSRCWSPKTVPTTRPATRCSRRCASSHGNGSKKTGDADHWRRRHAEHYATFAETAGPGLRGPDEVLWAARLVAELDNLRAAVGWALDRDDPADRELAVRIVAALASVTAMSTTVDRARRAGRAMAAAAAEQCRPELRSPVLGPAAYYEMQPGPPGARPRTRAERPPRRRRRGIARTRSSPYQRTRHTSRWPPATLPKRARDLPKTPAYARRRRRPAGVELSCLRRSGSYEGNGRRARPGTRRRRAGARAGTPSWRIRDCLARCVPRASPGRSSETSPPPRSPPRSNASRSQRVGLAQGGAPLGAARAGRRAPGTRSGDPERRARAPPRSSDRVARDQGARPQLAATLDWSLSPLVKLGRPEPAATFVGALTGGPLAEVGNFPGVDAARARTLERIRDRTRRRRRRRAPRPRRRDDLRRDRRVRAPPPRTRIAAHANRATGVPSTRSRCVDADAVVGSAQFSDFGDRGRIRSCFVPGVTVCSRPWPAWRRRCRQP